MDALRELKIFSHFEIYISPVILFWVKIVILTTWSSFIIINLSITDVNIIFIRINLTRTLKLYEKKPDKIHNNLVLIWLNVITRDDACMVFASWHGHVNFVVACTYICLYECTHIVIVQIIAVIFGYTQNSTTHICGNN